MFARLAKHSQTKLLAKDVDENFEKMQTRFEGPTHFSATLTVFEIKKTNSVA
jgi:hypothetical protein